MNVSDSGDNLRGLTDEVRAMARESDDKNESQQRAEAGPVGAPNRNLLAPVEHRTAGQQAELAVLRARDALVAVTSKWSAPMKRR